MRIASVFKIIVWIIVGLVLAGALGLALGFPVMWLWNWLVPAVFGLPAISYWQAVGLLVLCHLLFKSHQHGDHGKDRGHRKPWARFAKRVRSSMGEGDESVQDVASARETP